MSVSREEFEEWLDEHSDEALNYVDEHHRLSLDRWIKIYAVGLKHMAQEFSSSDEDDEDDDADEGPLNFDEE